MSWEIVITGCGTSHGNPAWGDPAWWSTDPRDARRRSGALLRATDGREVLIDTGPDLLHQLRDPYRHWDGVSYPVDAVTRCDGVLMTHDHADHAHGINDLRHVNRLMRHAERKSGSHVAGSPAPSIPLFGNVEHLSRLQTMFPYCFGIGEEFYSLSAPALVVRTLADDVVTTIAGLPVIPFAMSHGSAGRTTGFRIGDLAYLTDLKELPLHADQFLRNVGLLVLDMLRDEVHPTHLCWAEAMAIIARLRPQRTVLTHMGPEVRFAEYQARLPPTVEMAVDGWRAAFSDKLELEP